MAAPLIGPVDIEKYLTAGQIEQVLCGGENYDGSRLCRYEWVKKYTAFRIRGRSLSRHSGRG